MTLDEFKERLQAAVDMLHYGFDGKFTSLPAYRLLVIIRDGQVDVVQEVQ